MKYKYNDQWKDLTVKAGDTLPIGTIVPFGGNNITSNWLICDGTAISRTTYADLFSAIGTSFGEGDGSTTFNLPDLRSRVPLGLDSRDEDFDTIGNTYGEKEHTLTNDEMPTMYAKAPTSTSGGNITYFKNDAIAGYNGSGAGSAIATITGGNQSHNIVQPSLVTNYIIKAFQSVGAVGKVLNNRTQSNVDTYSCDYVNGIAGKILWTNPDPTSSFGTNTITLSSNDYDFLEFICIYVSSNPDITFSQKTIKGKGLVASAYYSSNNVTRIFDYTDETHYTSRHGFLGTSQDDTRVVPIYVIGYKTNTFN